MLRVSGILAIVVLLLAQTCRAQVESGPEPGSTPEPFEAYVVTGEDAERTVDVVKGRKGLPTVYLFVQKDKWDRPTARFVRVLDEALEKGVEGAESAQAIAVWVTDDPAASKEYLPRAQMSLRLVRTPFAVFEASKFGPKGWSINDAAHLTVVVTRGGKVVKSLGYDSVNDTEVPRVVELLKGK